MSRFWHWPDKIIRKRESRRLRDEHNKLAQEHADMLAALEEASRWLDVLPIEYRARPSFPKQNIRAIIARACGEG